MSDEGLLKRMEELERRVGMLEDVHAIRRLHHLYGYFIDKCMYDEAVDCYDEECEIHFFGGILRGLAGAHRMYCDGLGNSAADERGLPFRGKVRCSLNGTPLFCLLNRIVDVLT
jgi:hypothetical protein